MNKKELERLLTFCPEKALKEAIENLRRLKEYFNEKQMHTLRKRKRIL